MGALEDFGWDDGWRVSWEGIADAGTVPARVIAVHRDAFVVWTAEGERTAELSGRMRHRVGGSKGRSKARISSVAFAMASSSSIVAVMSDMLAPSS